MIDFALVPSRNRMSVLKTLALWIAFTTSVFAQGSFAIADEPVAELADSLSRDAKQSDALQKRLPDGRSLRSVGISDSQKFELIPSDYAPVKEEQLIDAINQWEDSTAETPSNRLRKAEYIVQVTDGLMTCEDGYVLVATGKRGRIGQSLGKVNFAVLNDKSNIENPQGPSSNLVSLSDGTLVALFDAKSRRRSRVPLNWKSRGVAGPRGYSFDLNFPQTLQTRFLFRVDSGVQLEADDGVLRAIEGTPDLPNRSDAAHLDVSDAFRWYELDAGGLNTVRLRSTGHPKNLTAEAIIIHRNAVEYNIDSAGLFFIQRMEISLPVGVSLPRLRVIGAKLTSIKVNASDASFTQQSDDDDSQFVSDYQAISPPGAIGRNDTRVSLTLMGQSDWASRCDLPLAGIVSQTDSEIPIVDACVSDDARITVGTSGRIVEWQLPDGWQRRPVASLDGLDVVTAQGTSLFASFESSTKSIRLHANSENSSENSHAPSKFWSSIRLTSQSVHRVRDLWLKSKVGKSAIDCDARFELRLNDRVIEPLHFQIQKDWEIDEVSFPVSGRKIESPQVDSERGLLVVWPESADINESTTDDDSASVFRMPVRVSGRRSIRSNGSRIVVPTMWMIRASDSSGRTRLSDDFTAAVIPPPDMNWAGETAMMPHRVDVDQLTPQQQRFFDGENRTTLFFKPRHRQIDLLRLESPSIDYQASVSLQISKRGNEIVEQCFVKVSSSDRGLDQLVVHTGPAVSRPPLRWIIPGQDGSLSTNLTNSDVKLSDVDGQGIYTINVAGLDLASRPLMASRHYAARNISTQLPSIPNAVSGTSKLYIGAGLEITNKSKGVQLVPHTGSPRQEFSASNQSMRQTSGLVANKFSDNDSTELTGLNLRYDSIQKPSIEFKIAEHEVAINLIANARTRLVASSRGTDYVETRILASLSVPLAVQFDPEMQLKSVTRNGRLIDLTKLSRTPLVLEPSKGNHRGLPEVIVLVWNRNQAGFDVVRRCRVPRIEFDAAVLKHEYYLVASADTFAPSSLLKNIDENTRLSMLETSPDQHVFLIRRNVLLACGWLIAMINFIVFWCMMKRSPVSVIFCLAVMCVSVLLWWPWRMTIVGWFVVPLIAGAMLVSARSWISISKLSSNDVAPDRGDISREDTRRNLPGNLLNDETTGSKNWSTNDFSWGSILKGWVFAIAITLPAFHGSELQAQTTLSELGTPLPRDSATAKSAQERFVERAIAKNDGESQQQVAAPVNVLIPMDLDHQQVGEFVYIPNFLHQRLFGDREKSSLQAPSYASAEYQIKIRESDVSTRDFLSASLLATFDLEFPFQRGEQSEANRFKQFRQCLIPLPYDRIEKIQSIGEEPTTLRFSEGANGDTIVVLPVSETVKIQASMRLKGSRQDAWIRFELGVPSVANSRVEVESEVDLRVLRVGGLAGHLVEEADLRRWSEVLGPTEQLDISFRIDPRMDAAASRNLKPLQRRYWVSSGFDSTTIDCEVDPPEAYAAGEVFQFVIRDSSMPILISSDWRLVDTLVYAPRRRRVSVMSVRDSPGPVQLLWKISNENEWESTTSIKDGLSVTGAGGMADNSTLSQGNLSGNHSIEIRIPEVVASSLGENAPAWIALRCLESLSFDPLPGDSLTSGLIEPLSVDQFLAGWSGYRGRIDRALVALDEIPSLRLRKIPLSVSRIEDRHQLRVSSRRLEVSYQADVDPGLDNFQPYLLSVPNSVELVDLYVDEIRQDALSVDSDGSQQFMIDRRDRPGETFNVSAFAIGELSPGEQFSPPVMVLTNARVPEMKSEERVSSYTVSRTRNSFIQIVEPFSVNATRSIATLTADSLSEGYLPVATWNTDSNTPIDQNYPSAIASLEDVRTMDESAEDVPDGGSNQVSATGEWGGVFRVQQKTAKFDCSQLIKLERLDRDWQVSNQIHFSGRMVPDYVDLEIPTRWCDSLEISPATAWSRQPSTNPLHQIVRVRCDAAKYPDQPFVVTGLLSQQDDGRVSVPAIRVLGSGKRNVFVQVPQRLTSELVQWRRVGLEETTLPKVIFGGNSDRLASSKEFADSDSVLAYRAVRERWSIDLAPLPELSLEPIASAQDNQVFLVDDSFCVLTQWDVWPGSLEKLLVSIPADADCLGAWSGGMTVSAKDQDPPSSSLGSMSSSPSNDETESIRSGRSKRKFLEIPLSLSQLPQSVKILIRVPKNRMNRSDYVPHLVRIPVTQAWLAIYQSEPLGDRINVDLSNEMTKLRNLSLARSAVESIELAVDIVAERSSDEVVPWVVPWVYRYLQLAVDSGRTAMVLDAVSGDEDSEPAELPEQSIQQFEEVQWRLLDRRIAVYANRFVPDLPSQFDRLRQMHAAGADGASRIVSNGITNNLSETKEVDYLKLLGDEAIFSSSPVPGFRLGQVGRLSSIGRAVPLGSASKTDLRLRRLLRNLITLVLVVGLLICLKPLKKYVIPVVVYPAFWLASLGIAGLLVAPSYVALSLILVALSMPWFPAKQNRRSIA